MNVMLCIAGCGLGAVAMYVVMRRSTGRSERLRAELQTHAATMNRRCSVLTQWLDKQAAGKSLGAYVRERIGESIGVYGLGSFGQLLVTILRSEGVRVVCIVDQRRELQGGRYIDVPVISMELLQNYQKDMRGMIVTLVPEAGRTTQEIERQCPTVPVIPLAECIERW